MDFGTNRFGDLLIDMCKAVNICIVNGRSNSSDDNGSFTCMTHNGESVIDLVLTNYSNFKYIVDFKVHGYTEYSNHTPLSFGIKIGHCERNNTQYTKTFYKWDERLRDQFKSDIFCGLHTLEGIVSNEQYSIDDKVKRYTEYITNTANKYFEKQLTCQNYFFTDNKSKERKRWFNDNCKEKRKLYREALEKFTCERSNENFILMKSLKKDYKYCVRRTKWEFNLKRGKEMNEMRRKKPREFWKMFKSKNQNPSEAISTEEFYTHFKNLAMQNNDIDDDVEEFLKHFDENRPNNENILHEIDRPITQEEIRKACSGLKRNKSAGIDSCINEYFLETADILVSSLEKLFNSILDAGEFPKQWTQGVIVPILKKPPCNDTNNYRGITLTSCFGKIFTSILNERIQQWCVESDRLTDAQFGFRADHSTTDAIFVLQSLINMKINKRDKMYAAFIDYQKAYDKIYRNGLWYKLIKEGINGKILNVMRAMYTEVKSCIKHFNTLSDFFSCEMGLFQGEITSPILFSLFINDLEIALQANVFSGINLDQISIYLILFADDCILLSDTPEGLQSHLDLLAEYCIKWKLTVNIDKTKIIVFRKGGRLAQNEHWTYSDIEIDVVEQFNYLGFVVSSGGSFRRGIDTLTGKALKAMNSIYTLTKDMDIPINIHLNLFDSYVSSILCYSSEIWGFSTADKIERVHRKFIKRILNVKMSTSNLAIYGETGRTPLYINWKIRILKYWFKLVNNKTNCILQNVYSNMLECCEKGDNNWLYKVKNMLNLSGFGEIWLFPSSVDVKQFIPVFKSRLIDTYISEWRISVNNSPSLMLFKELKETYGMSQYLLTIENKKHRHILTKLRTSSHWLNIEYGRHRGIERQNRVCELCNKRVVEDEYHFVLECEAFKELRIIHIPRYYRVRPSMAKLVYMLKTDSKPLLHKISVYLMKAFKQRQNILNAT
ncbi:uncharacterized protein LOC128558242 [Mercenaria mercenaria]|uniref:uncharacterized protein LOC128558242 n=1 Tax=Mercenaria mercenaria TaxID=6596 RepID=UPI00234F1426|nr:uncharacterized protein LOC128558242 [Mercenaria mercenaria]